MKNALLFFSVLAVLASALLGLYFLDQDMKPTGGMAYFDSPGYSVSAPVTMAQAPPREAVRYSLRIVAALLLVPMVLMRLWAILRSLRRRT